MRLECAPRVRKSNARSECPERMALSDCSECARRVRAGSAGPNCSTCAAGVRAPSACPMLARSAKTPGDADPTSRTMPRRRCRTQTRAQRPRTRGRSTWALRPPPAAPEAPAAPGPPGAHLGRKRWGSGWARFQSPDVIITLRVPGSSAPPDVNDRGCPWPARSLINRNLARTILFYVSERVEGGPNASRQ